MAGLHEEEIDPGTGMPIQAAEDPEAAFANEKVGIITPEGKAGVITRAELPDALKRGYSIQTPDEVDARLERQREEGRGAQTFIERAGSAATLGLTDVLARNVSPEYANKMRLRTEANEDAALAGTIGGSLSPMGAGGLVSGAGKAVAAKVGGSTALGRIGGAVAGGAAEGALFGYGAGVSELALSDKPITAERAVSTIGGNVLYGAAFGAGAGGLGGALAESATIGKAAVQKWAKRGDDAAGPSAAVPDDVARLDMQGAKVAREAELSTLKAARDVEARELYSVARQFDDALEKSWLQGGDKRFARIMKNTRRAVRNSLDSENEFVRYGGARTLNALDKQAQAIREYMEADAAKSAQAAAKVKSAEAEVAVKSARKDAARPGDTVNLRAATPEPVVPTAPPVNKAAQDLLEVNDALRARIEAIGKAPSSPRLQGIDAHITNLAHPPKKSFARNVLEQAGGGAGAALGASMLGGVGAAIGYGLGSKAAAAVLEGGLGSRLGAGLAARSAAASKAAAAFAKGTEKAGKAVRRVGPALSSEVLGAASFAPAGFTPAKPIAVTGSPLADNFKKREAELRAQTKADPATGKPVITGAARSSINERLQALWVVNPQLADKIESAAVGRLEFLASKLPPRPESQALKFGPDRWQPPELEMRKWARYVDAAENPDGVFERLADGKMSPEDAETLKAVYPAMFKDAQRQIMANLFELQESLPYRKRLMVSMLFDVPVEATLEPAMFQVLQETFTTEPGSEGGTQAPPADLGSIKKSAPDPTAAQRMSST